MEQQQQHQDSKPAGNDMVMGHRAGQLNLSNIRIRATDVEKSIDEMLFTLRYAPWSLHWKDVVDKMAVLNVQMQQLQDQLRPVSHHYVLHPKSVNQQNSVTVPIMLASRLYPEQQEVYHELYVKERESSRGNHASWKSSVENMCVMLTGRQGLLDPRGPLRRRIVGTHTVSVKEHDSLLVTNEEQDMLNIVGFGGLPPKVSGG